MYQDKDDQYWVLREENDEFLKRQTWWWRHYLQGSLRTKEMTLAREAEALVARRLHSMGYHIYQTTNNAPFDLWVENDHGGALRVEVKISQYHQHKRGGRFQANIRHHHQADIVVFIARNGYDWYFVMPLQDIYPRQNVTIWAACPGEHRGQWKPYLNAWGYLHDAMARTEQQLALFQS